MFQNAAVVGVLCSSRESEGGRGGLAVLWTKCSSQCVELLMRAAAERMHVRVTRVAVGAASDLAQISHCADKCKDIDVG